jgi:hypothetical protein
LKWSLELTFQVRGAPVSEDADLYSGGKDKAALPERRMLSIAFAHVPARAIHAFASLGIADILQTGPKDAAEIARAAGADASFLYRLLRFLSTIGVVEEAEDRRFSLTHLGITLRTQPVSVVNDNVLLMGSRPWEECPNRSGRAKTPSRKSTAAPSSIP